MVRHALLLSGGTCVFFGLLFPLMMTGLGQVVFPFQANGSLLSDHTGRVTGSLLVGQHMSHPAYLQPRPSINGYDAANSGGSNWGATNKKLIERIAEEAHHYQATNPTAEKIPVDAVTASGSGLDPDISLANALLQAPRIARIRNQPLSDIQTLIQRHAHRSVFGQSPYVTVLSVNIDLDKDYPRKHTKEHPYAPH